MSYANNKGVDQLAPLPRGGRGGYSNMKLVCMCHTGFKNGGLREWPLTENGAFQSGHS